jgi:hypothetical protein
MNDSYHTAIPDGDADSFVQLGEHYSKIKTMFILIKGF